GLDLPAGPHRPLRAQASRHQLPAGGHEDPGGHGAAARAAERPPPLQRSVLRRRGGAEDEPDRPAERGLEARDDHAHVRAQGRRRSRPRGAARTPPRAGHDRPARRPARVGASGHPAALRPARDRGPVPALHPDAQPDPPAPRRAARARGLDAQALRLRARRPHRGLRGRAAGAARAGEPGQRAGAGRASLVQPGAERAAVHDRGGHQRDPAQHHRRAGARPAKVGRAAAEGEASGYEKVGRAAAEGEASGYEKVGRAAAEGEASGYEKAGRAAAEGEASGYETAGRAAAEGEASGYQKGVTVLSDDQERAQQAEALIARMKAARGYMYPEWEF